MTAEQQIAEQQIAETPPTPENRRETDRPEGVPAQIGTYTWILPTAYRVRALDEVRDRIYDSQALRGIVRTEDLRVAAFFLLGGNYRLSEEERAAIVIAADPAEYADAVLACLFPPSSTRRTYSGWARSALLANGLRPEDIPDADLPLVLRQLVATNRAVPPQEFTEADEAAKERKALFAVAAK